MEDAGMKVLRVWPAVQPIATTKGSITTVLPVLEPNEIGVFNDTMLEFLDHFMLASKDHGIKGQEYIEAHQGWQCKRANTIKGELGSNSGSLSSASPYSLTGLRLMRSASSPFTFMVSGILTPRRSKV
ncbi:hypothetical protein ACEPAH_605 [Sanghuangporus vaninii]